MLYQTSLFLSAFILFLLQPLAAKFLLPQYGGSAGLWSVCMLFFQMALLAAYGYAWSLSRLPGERLWRWLHTGLAIGSLLFLPIGIDKAMHASSPELSIGLSLASLGLPLWIICASAPTLQLAYSRSGRAGSEDPYFLYAASNTGSLLALLLFPFVLERYLGITTLFWGLSLSYGLYLVLLLAILWTSGAAASKVTRQSASPIAWSERAQWILLSFVPCNLFLATSFYLSTDLAIPLIWILPLALYLLSFILSFAKREWLSFGFFQRNYLLFLIFPGLNLVLGSNRWPLWHLLLFQLANLFCLTLLCHRKLAAVRPQSENLTAYYFYLALGGVLAGLFNGLIAPHCFNGPYEFPIALLLSLLVIPRQEKCRWPVSAFVLGLLLLNRLLPASAIQEQNILELIVLVLILVYPGNARQLTLNLGLLFAFLLIPGLSKTEVLRQDRNFFGIKKVVSALNTHRLISQNTLHGIQFLGDSREGMGVRAYYQPAQGPIRFFQEQQASIQAMVIGLGTGTLACQFREQDQLHFVDIDPQVVAIAKNPKLFSFLRDCKTQLSISTEDGRLSLQKTKPQSLDLLVMDAFSSDAIPMHLLSMEAISDYRQKIKSHGALLFHISNRYLNLLPVLFAAGRALDMIVLSEQSAGNPKALQIQSEWVLLTENLSLAQKMMASKNWHFVAQSPSLLWTDDYSNILPLLK